MNHLRYNAVMPWLLAASALWLALPAAKAVEQVKASQEQVLEPVSAVHKNISIRLVGTEREAEVLRAISQMIAELMAKATLNVETALVSPQMAAQGLNTPTNVNRELVLSLDSDAAEPPMRVGLAITESDKKEEDQIAKIFFYNPADPLPLKNALRDYLMAALNVTIPPVSAAPAASPPAMTPPPMPGATPPAMPGATPPPMTAATPPPMPAATPPPMSGGAPAMPAQTPRPAIAPLAREESVNPRVEGEYVYDSGLSPVRNISIQLQGTEREQAVLKQLHGIIVDILGRARLNTTNRKQGMPNSIIVQARWDDADQYVTVGISFQTADGMSSQPVPFHYNPRDPAGFKQELQTHLARVLNLVIQ
jgi:hypothetical protein